MQKGSRIWIAAFIGLVLAMPAWERPNMLAKYFVTTRGTELGHRSAPQAAPRLAPR